MLKKLFVFILAGTMVFSIFVLPTKMTATAKSWEKVVNTGFGDANNQVIYLIVSFKDSLYAGTGNGYGGMLYRSSDGTNWTRTASGAFAANDYILFPFLSDDNYLYVGTANYNDGGKVFRSSDGENFTQINVNGFGANQNSQISAGAFYGGSLYVGTTNTTAGGGVWKYSGSGTVWTPANTAGFGSALTKYIDGMETFDDYLYAGTEKSVGAGQLWRYNGTSWSQCGTDGLGDVNNKGIFMYLHDKFNNYMYAGSYNLTTGASIYRSLDGATWERFGDAGLGDSTNDLAIPRTLASDKIIFGVRNAAGLLVMESDGNSITTISEHGFGEPANVFTDGAIIFKNYLYISTNNYKNVDGNFFQQEDIRPANGNSDGGQIWRTSLALPQTGIDNKLAKYVFDLLT